MSHSKERLLQAFSDYEKQFGKVPTRREMREFGFNDSAFYRIFGNWTEALNQYELSKVGVDESTPMVKDGLIDILRKNLTEEELKVLVKSTSYTRNPSKRSTISKETGYAKFIATGDSHIGHSKFRDDWWEFMIDRGIEEKVDFMYHTGDLLEGMSGRPGHIYELSEIGFEAQFAKAKSLIENVPFQIRMINGNHDNWYTGKADQGINVGVRLEESMDNVLYLGNDEADDVVNGIKVKLWHGNDGSSYAISYRTQKFVEQLYGGEKPNILLAGHAHKSLFYETRNVNVFETGTTCMQTGFMRGKKLAAHTGFWIIEVWSNENGITRIRPEWNAFYK